MTPGQDRAGTGAGIPDPSASAPSGTGTTASGAPAGADAASGSHDPGVLERCGRGWRPRAELDVVQVAPGLLGAFLTHGPVTVRVTEVEAYAGDRDPGSHTFRGRTARNSSMFEAAGIAYVYFTYGMHHALNLVCGPAGVGWGALIRAGEVVDGIEVARSRRGKATDRDLARGPGRLAQALGLTLQHDGMSLGGDDPELLLRPPGAPVEVRTGPRVGVSGPGGDGAAYPWRFWIADDPYVSAYRPAKPRRRPAS